MAHIVADRVKETSTTTGTGNMTLAGAVGGFNTFASRMANNDTCFYCIVGQTSGAWEVGLGTYVSATPALARTTVLRSSNSDSAVNYGAETKHIFITNAADRAVTLNNEKVIVLPDTGALPSTPSSGTMGLFARKWAGRMMPKFIGPSGVDNIMQPALFGNRIVMFLPSTGTTGTGSGTSLGPAWTVAGGTVSHPTPATTSPAITKQMKRTMYVNVATTTNQTLGIRMNAASERQFWRGNAAGLGGFFFSCRFIIELWPAATCRFFIGLYASNNAVPVASDTISVECVGLWHDTTDPNSGANSMNLVSRDASTTSKTSIALSNAIAAGNSYDFTMFCAPNGSEVFYRLDDTVNGVTYEGSKTTNLPQSSTFMQAQASMSNGTANTTVTTVGIGIAGLYCESDR